MTRSQLLQHFDTLAETPEAAEKLHELILQLAIRGRLLPQSSKDISAQAAADTAQKLADIDLPEIVSEETPFTLPNGWAWLRIGEAMRLFNGRAFKPTDWGNNGLPIIRIQNLNKPDAPFNYCDFEVDKKVLVKNDDLLISWSGTPGTSFGAFIWNRGHAVLNQHIFRAELIGHAFDKRFLRFAINGRLEEMIAKAHGAVGLQHITKGKLELLVLPVPPFAEQQRIVAKVEELLALCDELEARQTAAREHRTHLVRSALGHLTAGARPSPDAAMPARKTTPDSLGDRHPDHAVFVLREFPSLTATPDDVPALRQAILSLAVEGRLSANRNSWPDEPVPIGKFAPMQNGYAFESGWFTDKGIRLLRNANVSHGVMRWHDLACIDEARLEEFERFKLNEGDIVLSLDRPFISTGIKVARVRQSDLPCLLLQRVGRFQPETKLLNPHYLFLFLNSPNFAGQIDPGRSNGVPHISSKQVEAAQIFVPPLAEQHRIVAKVDELMRWCDELEARLTAAQTTAAALLDASLQEILAA